VINNEELVMSEFIPLRIDFDLVTAVIVPDMPLLLDSLIAFAAVQEGMEKGIDYAVSQEQLPLGCDSGVWQASYIDFSLGFRETFHSNRRFDVNETVLALDIPDNDKKRASSLPYQNGIISGIRRDKWGSEASSSVNKAYLFINAARHSARAAAYCIGNPDEIRYLLDKHVSHLGKQSRIDMGRIQRITITEDAEGLERWKHRPLPYPVDGYAKTFETLRPPYWKRENRQEAWVPLKKSKIRDFAAAMIVDLMFPQNNGRALAAPQRG
jgi:CRISPR type IV-associated protein Csf3